MVLMHCDVPCPHAGWVWVCVCVCVCGGGGGACGARKDTGLFVALTHTVGQTLLTFSLGRMQSLQRADSNASDSSVQLAASSLRVDSSGVASPWWTSKQRADCDRDIAERIERLAEAIQHCPESVVILIGHSYMFQRFFKASIGCVDNAPL
jgi:hypothetical protein